MGKGSFLRQKPCMRLPCLHGQTYAGRKDMSGCGGLFVRLGVKSDQGALAHVGVRRPFHEDKGEKWHGWGVSCTRKAYSPPEQVSKLAADGEWDAKSKHIPRPAGVPVAVVNTVRKMV